jgi:hypothetical protein
MRAGFGKSCNLTCHVKLLDKFARWLVASVLLRNEARRFFTALAVVRMKDKVEIWGVRLHALKPHFLAAFWAILRARNRQLEGALRQDALPCRCQAGAHSARTPDACGLNPAMACK